MNKSKKGFTLIELMITVAIIGILSAIAMPKFSEYKERGDLSRARSAMNRFEGVAFQFISDNPKDVDSLCASKKVDKIIKDIQQGGDKFTCQNNIGQVTVGGFSLSLTLSKQNSSLEVIKNTDSAPNGWSKGQSCWIVDKSGNC